MSTIKLFFAFIFIIAFSYPTQAQLEDWEGDDSWQWDDDAFDFDRPYISLFYGLNSTTMTEMQRDFGETGYSEIKLGYSGIKTKYEILHKYNASNFSISNMSVDLGGETGANEINAKFWKFAFNWEDGYGWKIGDGGIIPYIGTGLSWSRVSVDDPQPITSDEQLIALYEGALRFGTNYSAGLKIRIIPQLDVETAYDRSLIFRRHLFWRWAGSWMIESFGVGLLDMFVKSVLELSPAAAPIVNAVLKGAFLYAAYEVRKFEMNYPFGGEAPIYHNTFKFGLTYNF